jgi:branched-chain amino acid aminotransferase
LPLAFLCPEFAEGLDRVSVFETMRVYGGTIFCLGEHLKRLEDSCRAIGEALPFPRKELSAWLGSCLKEAGHKDASLRISVHQESGNGRLVLFITPFSGHPRQWYETGVALRTAVSRRWTLKAQDPQVKSSQYVSGVLAFLDKGDLAAHELLFFGSGGGVAEGTVSNVFAVKGKTLLTPSVASGILRGVTRQIVIGLAKKAGLKARETELTRHEFYSADECFLTNTSSEVLPVTKLDGRSIGTGIPGPVTRRLAQDFKKSIREGVG